MIMDFKKNIHVQSQDEFVSLGGGRSDSSSSLEQETPIKLQHSPKVQINTFALKPDPSFVITTKKALFNEEGRAMVGRLKIGTKNFVHGDALAEASLTKIFPQSLVEFKLTRRFDRTGYNKNMRPFFERVTSFVNLNSILRGNSKTNLALSNEDQKAVKSILSL